VDDDDARALRRFEQNNTGTVKGADAMKKNCSVNVCENLTLKISLLAGSLMAMGMLPTGVAAATAPANGDVELARRLESAFVKVADQASQSVVVISTTRRLTARSESTDAEDGAEDFEGTPFEFFFRRRGVPTPPRDIDSQGSGVILRANGYILTNGHVVNRADTIKVRLKDGTELPAEIIGIDDRTDVAVIKVNSQNLPAAVLGNSDDVKVGQWAVAIGAPYELDYSFTVGFISAKGRSAVWSRAGSAYEDYIQTDTSINPGNSGGPLCDIEGRVIGINTLIRGINRGIGFAIPINMARDIADQLIDKGKIVRPWIGVEIRPLEEFRDQLELPENLKDGVVVRSIYPDTPAAASDLKPADVIVAVDGVAVKTPRDLQRQILRKQVGQKIAIDVIRDGKPVTVTVQTGELPGEIRLASRQSPSAPKVESSFGMTVQTLTAELADKLNLKNTEGVVITDVEPGSIADQKGLQHGDVVTEVDRSPVRTAEQFKAALTKADREKGALLYVRRDGASTFVVLKEK
jgi:serine protease Do